ncbi:MAG: murein transglycosylase A [Cyanobacteria bacterium]|nr:murein transglycosylase A [Cyanobacteriota bacterium]MDW8202483.1 murein transglycosylase A [Cyanobacteriota bacterium SKYGB_h_bin112]
MQWLLNHGVLVVIITLSLALGRVFTSTANSDSTTNSASPASIPSPVAPSTPALPLRLLSMEQFPASIAQDEQLWQPSRHDRAALLRAIDHSLRYLQTPAAIAAYRSYPVPGISRERVQRSLERFQQLVQTSRSAQELAAAVRQEFAVYQSVGKDGQGTVMFTGYFEPVYLASRQPTAEFRYPLYRRPPDLDTWTKPHPTRAQLEGIDGLQGDRGRLRGLQLVWLRDRLEAFLVHVQGSARLRLPDGRVMTVGYAGRTEHPYTSIGRELVKDGKLRLEDLTLQTLVAYFQQHPEELNRYLPRNRSFIFFRETDGQEPTGSLSVPVTAERSIATDKSLMPPGALALIHTRLPTTSITAPSQQPWVSRYVLDQDTGSAIRGAGRVDIFMGTGKQAGDRAGVINSPGSLYYLLLKE